MQQTAPHLETGLFGRRVSSGCGKRNICLEKTAKTNVGDGLRGSNDVYIAGVGTGGGGAAAAALCCFHPKYRVPLTGGGKPDRR